MNSTSPPAATPNPLAACPTRRLGPGTRPARLRPPGVFTGVVSSRVDAQFRRGHRFRPRQRCDLTPLSNIASPPGLTPPPAKTSRLRSLAIPITIITIGARSPQPPSASPPLTTCSTASAFRLTCKPSLRSTAAAPSQGDGRHENATHYQGFALQPLVLIAEFVTRQGIGIYAYKANGHTLRDAIVFSAVPSTIQPHQALHLRCPIQPLWSRRLRGFRLLHARFGADGCPRQSSMRSSIHHRHRIGGNTTILATEQKQSTQQKSTKVKDD